MRTEPGLTRDDVLVAVTTLSFDIAGLELWLPLTTGARLVIADRETAGDGGELAGLLRESGATVMQATPATWRLLIDSGWKGNATLKALCGGEALPPELAAALRPRCAQLWNLYGPTETTIWSTACRVATDAPPTVGRPIAGTQVHVLDRRLRRVPLGVAGEVYLGGDGVAHGYLRRPALTAERFVPDPFGARPGARLYRTGDVGRLLPDGELRILGRTDHQVKVRGFRIELGEIEATLARHPAVREAVALAREDTPGDRRLVAYVVPAEGAPPAAGDLRRHAAETLPDYMIPSAWVTLEALPRTPNAKVDRRARPAPVGVRPDLDAGFVEPRTPWEREIAVIWRSVLEVDRVGVRVNFFDLGGHSLLLMPVIDQLKKRLGVRLRPGELVLPTLGQLAALCEERRRESGGRDSGGLFRQLFKAIRSSVSSGNPPE
jgi:acyl-coenzyme A synthetase/AMP-(fatty) acid ligase